MNCKKISKVKIATAFISNEGVDIIKEIIKEYKLTKNSVEVYISPEFSTDKPHIILQELVSICKVYMVINSKFHAKVYFLKGQDTRKLLFGSSNLTYGGFTKNIEFNSISQIDANEEIKVNMFFDYCKNNSKEVDRKLISFYEEKNELINQIKESQKKLEKDLYKFEKSNDSFAEDDYDLKGQYFTFEDYETLFSRNQILENNGITKRRTIVRQKILAINEYMYNDIKKLKVYHHWREANISSLIRPCVYNYGRVAWVGVRYGKHEKEVKQLNTGAERGEEWGFQKHACIQYCIMPNGVEINLFHAVKNDAIDRDYLQGKINSLAPQIIEEIRKFKGEGYVWIIYDDIENETYEFYFDKEEPEEFIKFYRKNDRNGRESYLAYYIHPDDEILGNINSIGDFIIGEFKKLIPLYNLISLRL